MRNIHPVLFHVISILFICNCEGDENRDSVNNEPVNIPDRAFLYNLITLGVDTNADSIISYGEAEAVTSLDITNYYGYYVTDITGLEAFINLETLILRCNVIEELDLSHNASLKQVIAYDNGLHGIDVTKCKDLEELHVGSEGYCDKNRLSELNLTNNHQLKILRCGNNILPALELEQNPQLEVLECHLNQIKGLNLSNNSAITDLIVWGNQITNLDVSNCSSLKNLDFRGNQISAIELSGNVDLQELDGCRNLISSIHICNNKELKKVLLSEMPSLEEVCVWTLPFPPEGVFMDITGAPGITFTCGGEN